MNDLFIFRLGGILIIVNNRVTKVAKQGDNLVGHLNTSDAKIQDY